MQTPARANAKYLARAGRYHPDRLENGITVLARPNFNSPSVVVSGYLATGRCSTRMRSWGWPILPRSG